jgi:uncharacterized membrane protein
MSTRAKYFKLFSSILSLGATFGVLWLLSQKIQAYIAGDHSSTTILHIILLAIALLILPFIFLPKAIKRKQARAEKSSPEPNETQLELKIRKVMELRGEYAPNIIQKCPKCGFENPSHTKKCFNCNFSLSGF